LSTFGVIVSLAKCDHPDVVDYFLGDEFLPFCLYVLKFGVGISITVSVFILQRLMNHPDEHREIIQRPKRHQNCV
jgi:hypothetical protein